MSDIPENVVTPADSELQIRESDENSKLVIVEEESSEPTVQSKATEEGDEDNKRDTEPGALKDEDICQPCQRKTQKEKKRVFAPYYCTSCENIDNMFFRFCEDCYNEIHVHDLRKKDHALEVLECPDEASGPEFDPKIHCGVCMGKRGKAAWICKGKLCNKLLLCSKCHKPHQNSGEGHKVTPWRPHTGKKKVDKKKGYAYPSTAKSSQNTVRNATFKNYEMFDKKSLVITLDPASNGISNTARVQGNLSMVADFLRGKVSVGNDIGGDGMTTKWTFDSRGIFIDRPGQPGHLELLSNPAHGTAATEMLQTLAFNAPEPGEIPAVRPIADAGRNGEDPDDTDDNHPHDIVDGGPSPYVPGKDSAKVPKATKTPSGHTPPPLTAIAPKRSRAVQKLDFSVPKEPKPQPPLKRSKKDDEPSTSGTGRNVRAGPQPRQKAEVSDANAIRQRGPVEKNPLNLLPQPTRDPLQLISNAKRLDCELFWNRSEQEVRRKIKGLYKNIVKLDKCNVAENNRKLYKAIHIDPMKCSSKLCGKDFKERKRKNTWRPSQQCIGCNYVGTDKHMSCGRVVHMDTCHIDKPFYVCRQEDCNSQDYDDIFPFICANLALHRYDIIHDDENYPADWQKLEQMKQLCEEYEYDQQIYDDYDDE